MVHVHNHIENCRDNLIFVILLVGIWPQVTVQANPMNKCITHVNLNEPVLYILHQLSHFWNHGCIYVHVVCYNIHIQIWEDKVQMFKCKIISSFLHLDEKVPCEEYYGYSLCNSVCGFLHGAFVLSTLKTLREPQERSYLHMHV